MSKSFFAVIVSDMLQWNIISVPSLPFQINTLDRVEVVQSSIESLHALGHSLRKAPFPCFGDRETACPM